MTIETNPYICTHRGPSSVQCCYSLGIVASTFRKFSELSRLQNFF